MKGLVYDYYTNETLADVSIMLPNIAHNVTTSKNGDFWRLLVPGTYTIGAYKDGYEGEIHTPLKLQFIGGPKWLMLAYLS